MDTKILNPWSGCWSPKHRFQTKFGQYFIWNVSSIKQSYLVNISDGSKYNIRDTSEIVYFLFSVYSLLPLGRLIFWWTLNVKMILFITCVSNTLFKTLHLHSIFNHFAIYSIYLTFKLLYFTVCWMRAEKNFYFSPQKLQGGRSGLQKRLKSLIIKVIMSSTVC